MPRGATIKIFLVDGNPDGLRLVDKSNWTGNALICPRARFGQVKSRKEFERPGVYVLVGHAAESGWPMIYVGEGDPVRPRLENHHREKDFWTSIILFTSSSENLNKAHVQYLESRLVELAKNAKRADIQNGNVPQRPNLTEADQAEMEAFLDEMLLVYPVLSVTAFEQAKAEPAAGQRLVIKNKSVEAVGFDTPSGFVVQRGSQAIEDMNSAYQYTRDLRKTLLEQNVLVRSENGYRFAQDYTFDSPSGAAQLILGRSANGRVEWKDERGVSLKELQERATPQEPTEPSRG